MNTALSSTNNPSTRQRRRMLILLGVLLLALLLASFSIGRYGVPLVQILRIFANALLELIRKVFPTLPTLTQTWTPEMQAVVLNIRLPRILIACLVGCCLAAAGVTYQGVFQNPMAAPDILGASSGAAFGAALAILLGGSARMIMLSAFFFSLLTVGLVFLIAERAPGMKVINLILAGIMVSSLFTAGTSYIKLVADPSNQLPQITYWLMGSLAGVKKTDLAFIIVPMLLGLIPLYLLRWQLNLLSLGDEEAHTLGVNTRALRLMLIICATLVTAASVSVSGMIGWVGLVIPHLGRRLVGSNYRYLMPASFLAGAGFLLLVDNVSRRLLAVEIPIGILTAFIGAPFFIYLLCRKEKSL